jgi:O-6-methylguanine DNA methyltransferase
MHLLTTTVTSPLGDIVLVSDGHALRALDFADYEARMHRLLRLHYGDVTLKAAHDPGGVAQSLRAWFAGDLRALDAIPVATGGTVFQRSVWAALRTIPSGTTETYAGLGARIGHPKAARAVGLANGANPIGIVVPCHRVIGASGHLTGYAGGVERKRWLLQHEGALDRLAPSMAHFRSI